MIIFDLLCSCGCQFEGWFRDRDDFRLQLRTGIVQCPSCGGSNVHKILSPVAIQKGRPATKDLGPVDGAEESTSETEQAIGFLKAMHHYVTSHFEDVGTKLAEESLKMHFGVTEPRNIRGVASEEEEGMLKKEGIELLKIPSLPEEENLN